jgi:deazaflavin-dependent oxidoreductase (nitroreductase family)
MGWYVRTVKRLGRTRPAIAFARTMLHPLDMMLLRISGGRLHAGPVPTLVLTTTGRMSGRPHTVPLFFARDGGAVIVADFNAGRDRPPHWAENLAADPAAVVSIRGRERRVGAVALEGDEREAGIDALRAVWPGYREVQALTDRPIRVFRLE